MQRGIFQIKTTRGTFGKMQTECYYRFKTHTNEELLIPLNRLSWRLINRERKKIKAWPIPRYKDFFS